MKNLAVYSIDADYWMQLGRDAILESLEGSADINTNLAKNVILFIGDGMSLPTVTAARIYKAQYEARQQGLEVNGEETFLTFEKLPHVGLSKVRTERVSITVGAHQSKNNPCSVAQLVERLQRKGF